jgi:hypothetical protein
MTRPATPSEIADHNHDHRKNDRPPTSQERADDLLREHQAARRFGENERHDAALELCGAVNSLILTDSVPSYMHDYLRARVARLHRAFGLQNYAATAQKQVRPITDQLNREINSRPLTAEQCEDISRRST